jgi:hypothetical protein
VVQEDLSGDKVLVGYYTSKEGEDGRALKKYLQGILPGYMVPSDLIQLERFPLTPNGKIDRRALSLRKEELKGLREEYIGPRAGIEFKLVEIWEEVLGRSGIGIRDNFFELGGHSLKGTQLVSRISKELNSKISLRDIFTYPRIEELGKVVLENKGSIHEEVENIEEQEYYELSHSQKRLWVLDQLEEDGYAYNMPASYEFVGRVNVAGLNAAFNRVIARHESLRTRFITVLGEPKQKVENHKKDFEVRYIDLRGRESAKFYCRQLAEEDIERRFDLSQGPLLRSQLIQTEEDRYVFLFNMHHIISDGWSVEVLVNEIISSYEGYITGDAVELPELKIQYKDYSSWQRKQLSGEKLKRDREYWLSQFKEGVPVLELPLDYPRPSNKSYRGDSIKLNLSKELTANVFETCKKANVSNFMFLLSCIKVLFHLYTGKRNIMISSMVSGRNQEYFENQIGFYLNTLCFNMEIHPSDTFYQLLKRVKICVVSAFNHQDYPFDLLVTDLKIKRESKMLELFNYGFTWNATSRSKMESLDFEVNVFETDYNISQTDMWFHGHESAENIEIALNYDSQLFKKSTINNMIVELESLIHQFVKNPEILMNDICVRRNKIRANVLPIDLNI